MTEPTAHDRLTREQLLARACDFLLAFEDATSPSIDTREWGRAFWNDDCPGHPEPNFFRLADVAPEGARAAVRRLHMDAPRYGSLPLPAELRVYDQSVQRMLQGWLHEAPAIFIFATDTLDGFECLPGVERLELDEVLDAQVALRAEEGDAPDPTFDAQAAEYERRVADSVGAQWLGIRVDGALASWGSVVVLGRTAQLEGVSTFSAFRRRGFASRLGAARLGIARAAGCDVAFARVMNTNNASHELQGSLGLRSAGGLTRFQLGPQLPPDDEGMIVAALASP